MKIFPDRTMLRVEHDIRPWQRTSVTIPLSVNNSSMYPEVGWCLYLTRNSFSPVQPTPSEIRELAEEICNRLNDGNTPKEK